MQTHIERVAAAIDDLKLGKMIILTDDPADRENEGDLIIPAEMITRGKNEFYDSTFEWDCVSVTYRSTFKKT